MRYLALLALAGCPKQEPQTTVPATAAEASAPAIDASPPAIVDAGEPAPFVSADDAERALYLGASAPCNKGDSDDGRIRCMLAHKYAKDAQAMSIAVDLFKHTGDVAGLQAEETFHGGFRGEIHIVPELPVEKYRVHLERVAGAMRDFDELFAKLEAKKPATPKYRWRAVLFRFFRSTAGTRPSAFANGWVISYNLMGGLLQTEQGARETLFHELFHSNDHAHGDWSGRVLRSTFDAIVKKCGTTMACLAPYAPTETVVRGGTYYAFEPDNGDTVREYAAELALRWYQEHRLITRGEKPAKKGGLGGQNKAFKCGPPENAKSWSAMVTEFFGGIDLVPACE